MMKNLIVVTVCIVMGFTMAKAAKEDSEAQYEMGMNYWRSYNSRLKDRPCDRSSETEDLIREAIRCFREASSKGHAHATYMLGHAYAVCGVMSICMRDATLWSKSAKKEYSKAVEQWSRAAERGDVSAQYHLGMCYRLGIGVPQNLEEAKVWFRKAAKQGDLIANEVLNETVVVSNMTRRLYVERDDICCDLRDNGLQNQSNKKCTMK